MELLEQDVISALDTAFTMTLVGVASSAVGPLLLAVVEGRTGDYSSAVLLLAVIPAVMLVLAARYCDPPMSRSAILQA